MQFGLFSMNTGPCSYPEPAAAVAKAAEAAGFDSLWVGEHVVLPDPQAPPSPLPPEARMVDPIVSLSFLAAHTQKVKLGTGIIILPQRNPLVLAKELASLDVMSNGRLIFGVGIGYLEPEFRALGAPFDQRGPRTVDYLNAMKVIWTQEKPSYQGRFVQYGDVQAHPQPVQKPHPPIVMGGHTPPAFRRAVEVANGWYGFALDVDATAKCIEGLRAAAQQYRRPAEWGELEISVTPRGQITPAVAQRFADLGVHRLVLIPRGRDQASIEQFVAQVGETLVGKV